MTLASTHPEAPEIFDLIKTLPLRPDDWDAQWFLQGLLASNDGCVDLMIEVNQIENPTKKAWRWKRPCWTSPLLLMIWCLSCKLWESSQRSFIWFRHPSVWVVISQNPCNAGPNTNGSLGYFSLLLSFELFFHLYHLYPISHFYL